MEGLQEGLEQGRQAEVRAIARQNACQRAKARSHRQRHQHYSRRAFHVFALAASAIIKRAAHSFLAYRRRQIAAVDIVFYLNDFIALLVVQMHLQLVKGDIDIIFTAQSIDRTVKFIHRMAAIA